MKLSVLKELRDNKHIFISGEDLSKKLGVSRTAVWKHINALKEDGYIIESISRKGYKLVEEADSIIPEDLKEKLKDYKLGDDIHYFESIGSTNNYAKKIALDGCKEGTIVITDQQTEGKGRLGRTWISKPKTSVLMSMVLRPNIHPTEASKITQIAAAAISVALNKMIDAEVKIKWPNDVIINKKKISGILTEMSAELDYINYVIVGMGINVNVEEFQEDIAHIASSIKNETGVELSRSDLVVNIIKEFENLYNDFVATGKLDKTINICKENSITVGARVRIQSRSESYEAEAIDLNSDGELIIKKDNGEIINIVSGEVSVRGLYNYV